MHEHVVTPHATGDRMLYVWFEPWAEGLGFPPGMTVYGWANSTLQVVVDGEAVRSFDQPAADPGPRLSVREATTILLGPPPVPTPEEGAPE